MCKWVCLWIYICLFYLSLVSFPSVCFVRFQSICFYFILLYCILFYYHPLYAIYFLRRDRKRVTLSRTGVGETKRSRGREDGNQNIMYEKQLFAIKEKRVLTISSIYIKHFCHVYLIFLSPVGILLSLSHYNVFFYLLIYLVYVSMRKR